MGSGDVIALTASVTNDIPMMTQLFGNNMPIWLESMAVLTVVGFFAMLISWLISAAGLWRTHSNSK